MVWHLILCLLLLERNSVSSKLISTINITLPALFTLSSFCSFLCGHYFSWLSSDCRRFRLYVSCTFSLLVTHAHAHTHTFPELDARNFFFSTSFFDNGKKMVAVGDFWLSSAPKHTLSSRRAPGFPPYMWVVMCITVWTSKRNPKIIPMISPTPGMLGSLHGKTIYAHDTRSFCHTSTMLRPLFLCRSHHNSFLWKTGALND